MFNLRSDDFVILCLTEKNIRRSNSSLLINNLLYQEKNDNKGSREKMAKWRCLTSYTDKADAMQVDEFVAKLVKENKGAETHAERKTPYQ